MRGFAMSDSDIFHVRTIESSEESLWDEYIRSSPQSSVYHLMAFKHAIANTYKLKSWYFATFDNENRILAVLPLFFIPSKLFGNSLVSLPFCDYGGMVYSNTMAARLLLDKAFELRRKLKVPLLELRQTETLSPEQISPESSSLGLDINNHKVRMQLLLPNSADNYFSKIPSKLRAQIKRPQKEGCTAQSGGIELLSDFYKIFAHNMRDLGSPVHSINLIRNILSQYGESARIFVIYNTEKNPLACSLVIGHNQSLVNPWASSDKRFKQIAPNMLLYWEMIKYAIEKKFTYFDFGRSSVGEGTYLFKKQWGAEPVPLNWYNWHSGNFSSDNDVKGKKKLFIALWSKIPLTMTKVAGPYLRKQISA
jgi:FemAB-related protein (PEP-CTERM system-associated)